MPHIHNYVPIQGFELQCGERDPPPDSADVEERHSIIPYWTIAISITVPAFVFLVAVVALVVNRRKRRSQNSPVDVIIAEPIASTSSHHPEETISIQVCDDERRSWRRFCQDSAAAQARDEIRENPVQLCQLCQFCQQRVVTNKTVQASRQESEENCTAVEIHKDPVERNIGTQSSEESTVGINMSVQAHKEGMADPKKSGKKIRIHDDSTHESHACKKASNKDQDPEIVEEQATSPSGASTVAEPNINSAGAVYCNAPELTLSKGKKTRLHDDSTHEGKRTHACEKTTNRNHSPRNPEGPGTSSDSVGAMYCNVPRQEAKAEINTYDKCRWSKTGEHVYDKYTDRQGQAQVYGSGPDDYEILDLPASHPRRCHKKKKDTPPNTKSSRQAQGAESLPDDYLHPTAKSLSK
ncbi:uncharacterized protein [Littorina saxatilis]|uniref:uncharacterized protein n=1 Tax=Littorina saxatilis TaxID=31220 RepID=UPI0038B57685